MMKEDRPPTSNKMTMEMYFFSKLCLNGFASEFHSLLGPYRCTLCVSFKQICSGKASKKYISMVILFDVGGPT